MEGMQYGWSVCVLFCLGFGTDFAWAKWTVASNKHRPFIAANWSMVLFTSGLAYTLCVVDREWGLVVSYLVGGYIGTVIAVYKKPDTGV